MGTEMTERCATCNAPAEVEGRPGCGCATRAAQREDAVAEAADFHPLRVRPYVAVSGPGGEAGGAVPEPYVVEPAEAAGAASAAVSPEPPGGSEPYEADPEPYEDPDVDDDEPGRRRRGPIVVVAAVAATAVTVGAVVLATQLLAGSDSAERALPDSATSAPQLVLPSADASVSRTPSASASASRSASASASASASRTAAAGSTGVSASRSPSRSASTSPSPRRSASPTSAPVLSMGDHGPEVVELQERLRKVWLYSGNSDGKYTSAVRDSVSRYQAIYGVKGDPDGVYGAHTRASLESKTTYP
ncbi:MAG: hypothetical protein QOF84_2224 [Streptomyces sp.]|nr:hypothetical protein [Streptomyces sp.]